MTNALAYKTAMLITAEKSFVVQGSWQLAPAAYSTMSPVVSAKLQTLSSVNSPLKFPRVM